MRTPRRNPNIKYINPEIPDFQLPDRGGLRYRAMVPDTLDLAERAAHAVHTMTATTDHEANAEIYWRALLGAKPPIMYHDVNDCCEFKWYAPSLLLRQVCGSEESLDVEWHRMANLLQMQGPDGLLYIPLIGRPWQKSGWESGWDQDKVMPQLETQQLLINMFGRMLESATVYYLLTGDEQWRTLVEKAVGGIRGLALDRGDFAYLEKMIYAPGAERHDCPIPPPNISHSYEKVGQGLIAFHRMTGSEAALELGYKLARFFQLGHSGFIGPKGEFRINHACRSSSPTRPVSSR